MAFAGLSCSRPTSRTASRLAPALKTGLHAAHTAWAIGLPPALSKALQADPRSRPHIFPLRPTDRLTDDRASGIGTTRISHPESPWHGRPITTKVCWGPSLAARNRPLSGQVTLWFTITLGQRRSTSITLMAPME